MKTDYAIDQIEHHLNDAIVIRREIVSTPLAGRAIERTLETSIKPHLVINFGLVKRFYIMWGMSNLE